jgi:HK97 family phage portal protein
VSFLSKTREILTGEYLSQRRALGAATDKGIQQKFTPLDATVNWQYYNHLVYTANTIPYSQDYGGDGNSAVFACLRALAYASIEAPLRVWKLDPKQEREPIFDSPILDLLEEPHPDLDLNEIRWWSSWARHIDGNAYVLKVRSGNSTTGMPVELWPISPTRMRPHTERGSNNFIDWYELDRYQGGPPQEIPVANVIHFKLGVDPYDTRKGIAPLKRLVREIASDSEATRYADALLRNFGTPGLVAKLPAETLLSPKQIDELKANITRSFSGERRGSVGVLSGGADMEQFGFSPDQLNLKILHDVPETRIAAVMGVDPLVARLGVGLEQTSNYASARQVRENFTELTIVPLWIMDESKWNRKLKVDFTSDRSTIIAHDLTQVRSLQEDENAKHQRLREDFKAGMITREMALRGLGYDSELPNDDILMVPTGVTYVTVADAMTEPPEEQPALPAPLSGVPPAQPAARPGAKARGDVFAEVVQSIVDQAAGDFAEDLQKLQNGQHRRITAKLVNGSH